MTPLTQQLEDKKKGCGKPKCDYDNTFCGDSFGNLCPSCKSELKGRLDALKDEVEWLKICYRRIVKIIIVDDNMEDNPTAVFIKDRLASIQEEIKLIEERI